MTAAGDLEWRIRIERPQSGQDDTGGQVSGGYSPVANLWAKRIDLSASESLKADQLQGARITIWRVYSSSVTRAITNDCRIRHPVHAAEPIYEITGSKETSEGLNRFTEFTTVVYSDAAITD